METYLCTVYIIFIHLFYIYLFVCLVYRFGQTTLLMLVFGQRIPMYYYVGAIMSVIILVHQQAKVWSTLAVVIMANLDFTVAKRFH